MWRVKSFFAPSAANPYWWWRLLRWVVLAAITSALVVSTGFIYQHIYQTLNEANSVVVLSSTGALDQLNLTGFAEAEQKRALKAATTTLPRPLRNIFQYGATTTPRARPTN